MCALYAGRGLHGHIVELIGSRIVGGQYPPGATLFAETLEAELEVSKTVVREALKVLAAKGLVESRQKRGTLVRPRQAWNLLDADVLRWQGAGPPDFTFLEGLAEVRDIVEPAAARLAAQRRTEEDLERIAAALEAMSAAGADPDAIIAADLLFHRAVLDATHNELLSRMEVILASGLQMRDRFVHHGHYWSDPVPPHAELLRTITARDADGARQVAEKLLAQSSADLAEARLRAERRHGRSGRNADAPRRSAGGAASSG